MVEWAAVTPTMATGPKPSNSYFRSWRSSQTRNSAKVMGLRRARFMRKAYHGRASRQGGHTLQLRLGCFGLPRAMASI